MIGASRFLIFYSILRCCATVLGCRAVAIDRAVTFGHADTSCLSTCCGGISFNAEHLSVFPMK